jgi:hypothetical protein
LIVEGTIAAEIVFWAITAVTLWLAAIGWNTVVGWFREHETLVAEDLERVGFTLQRELANGNYEVVQGVFDRRTDKVMAGRKMVSPHLDEKLREVHRHRQLAVY